MTRVTFTACYGVTSSSFFIRSVLELAKTASQKVRRIIEHDMCVDDLFAICFNLKEAKNLSDQCLETLQICGFPQPKWTSHTLELIKRLPETLKETKE